MRPLALTFKDVEITSEPAGASIFRMKGQQVADVVGYAPRKERFAPGLYALYHNPYFAAASRIPWFGGDPPPKNTGDYEGMGWRLPRLMEVIMLPVWGPIMLLEGLMDVAAPPWGPPRYAAAYRGEFLAQPTHRTGRRMHFDFRQGAVQIPDDVLAVYGNTLRSLNQDELRQRFGEPLRHSDGYEPEWWEYEGLRVAFMPGGGFQPDDPILAELKQALQGLSPEQVRAALGAPGIIHARDPGFEVWDYTDVRVTWHPVESQPRVRSVLRPRWTLWVKGVQRL